MDSFVADRNTKMTIITSLGQSNALRIALIYSKRKLKDNEIVKIVFSKFVSISIGYYCVNLTLFT